ncbi:MAG: hypothetical protein PVI18_12255 [Desulfobacterales bacterium]
MKRKSIRPCVILLAIMMLLPLAALASGARETVETQINKMLARMQESSFKELSRDAKIDEIEKPCGKRPMKGRPAKAPSV